MTTATSSVTAKTKNNEMTSSSSTSSTTTRPWVLPNMYWSVGLCMIFCCFYVIIKVFTPIPMGLLSTECELCQHESSPKYCICIRETIMASTWIELFCIANSRITAYLLYPLYILLNLTMARNLRSKLQHTIIVEYIPLTKAHHLHKWCGTIVGVGIIWHSIWHIIRWSIQGNLYLLLNHRTGITGLFGFIITFFLVWPMRLNALKQSISFEIRKRIHYLSWLWMIALMLHAPAQHIFYIIGIPFLIYLLDWFYGCFISTYMAPHARFVRLESAVMIRVPKPNGFELKGAGGAYCYLCVPWVSNVEWHAFSVFKDPFDNDYVCFCIAVTGDWTRTLHEEIREPIYRRLWIYGPFPSPFESATDNDNIISIATGIGITPALSVIKSLEDHRKMHLIWMVRDASLLEFMIDYGFKFDEDAYTLIFYTGTRDVVFRRSLPYNVYMLKGRPDLDQIITSLIKCTKTVEGIDLSQYERLQEASDIEDEEGHGSFASVEHLFYAEITRLLLIYTADELFHAAVRRSAVNSRRVTFDGLRDLMNAVFVRKFSDAQLKILFDQADEDCNGAIDAKEFDIFIKRLEEKATRHNAEVQSYRSKSSLPEILSVTNGSCDEDDSPNNNKIDDNDDSSSSKKPFRPENWRLMYCGGGAKVIETLREFSKEHQIHLSIESFDW